MPDDTKMLLPSLNKISTIEQNILAIKQKVTKRGDGTLEQIVLFKGFPRLNFLEKRHVLENGLSNSCTKDQVIPMVGFVIQERDGHKKTGTEQI